MSASGAGPEEAGVIVNDSGVAIAYTHAPGARGAPGLLFLPGFRSTQDGLKAQALARFAAARGLALTRFDYTGHGRSGGVFEAATLSTWIADAALVLERIAGGRQVLVGSSMGGYIALHLACAHAETVAGLVLIAPAVDMTERIVLARLDADRRGALERDGVIHVPSAYGDGPYPITRDLIVDGRRHLLLGQTIDIACPVRLLHGARDPDVPLGLVMELTGVLCAADLSVSVVPDGDHRLSRPQDLALLEHAIDAVLAQARPSPAA
jgi:pimeloyl-ACP methyl ester carboxylesterase